MRASQGAAGPASIAEARTIVILDRLRQRLALVPAPMRGIGCMLGSAFGSSAMNGLIRGLTSDLHAFEIAFFRNVMGLLVMTPAMMQRGWSVYRTSKPQLHALRGVCNAIAMLCFFYALTITPLATVAALGFTAPLFATLLAALVLKETVGPRRWMGLLIGFIGALIIIRPGLGFMGLGPVLLLISAFAWSVALLVIKVLSRTDSSLTITVWAGTMLAPITGLAALSFWQWPDPWQLLVMLAIGFCGTLTQMGVAQAFREADASLVLPFDFTKLLWSALIGYLFFAEIPDLPTVLGGAIICGSVSYIAYRESQRSGDTVSATAKEGAQPAAPTRDR